VLTVHPRGRRHVTDPSRLMEATRAIYGEEAARRVYGEVRPVPAARILETGEGASVALAGRKLLFLEAPGHARHHVIVRDGRTGHVFAGDNFGLSYREIDVGGRQFLFPTTSPSQFDPPELLRSIDRVLALEPEAVYVTHFGQLRDIPRLGADLKRLLGEHVELALRWRGAGADRRARLVAGLRELLFREAARQGWALSGEALMAVFGFDVELNAQGLEAWLDSESGAARSQNAG
jgi:hydroxyacylglutathione hydrolase